MYQAPSGLSLSTPARRRRRTNQQQLAILMDFYWNNTAYPNRQQLQQLSQQLGFSHDSVNTWFQNQRQSLRRAGRDDRLIPTGHRRSDQNQAQVVPHPHVPSQNNTTTPGAYVDDDDPPSDDPPDQDPPSNVQAQLHHNGQLDGPPLYRPIPHHASAMNPFVDASASSSNHPLHTSAFTANTSNTAASASSVHVHHQSQNPYNPQQPRQQHDAGKTTVIPGKQPVDFYFYHYDYPMETIADAKFLEHPPIQTSQHLH